jgi:hypothetical protein
MSSTQFHISDEPIPKQLYLNPNGKEMKINEENQNLKLKYFSKSFSSNNKVKGI